MHELDRRASPTTWPRSWSGAYQETLGDLHNLFGDTHVVHIRLQEGGGWWIEEIVKGDTANKVLEYMEYDTDELYPRIARDCERAIQEGRMSITEAQAVKRFYENELNGYAYLEVEQAPETRQRLDFRVCQQFFPGVASVRRSFPGINTVQVRDRRVQARVRDRARLLSETARERNDRDYTHC